MTINPQVLTLRAKKLGALIRDARLASGLSLEECAHAIGVSSASFESYEMGSSSPSLPELEVLAYTLDIPMEHFWEEQAISTRNGAKKKLQLDQLVKLRQRMIGALIRQARMSADLSLDELATDTQIPVSALESYELGNSPIPLPHLEMLSSLLNRSIRDFQDRSGPVGRWAAQQRAISDFLTLPDDLQDFVSKPINRPYLELAQRLSEMSVDKLRAVAEGLLEITL
jgi:transcriptional regulator with XRE-family HTH domain